MKILFVEDNHGDQLIMREALQDTKVECSLDVAGDGAEAMEYLEQRGRYAEALRPDLVIVDLNLPKRNGRELLSDIKADARFKHIPVLVLSNSAYPKDICECYALGASAYVGKPSSYQGYLDFARVLRDFWSTAVRYCSGHTVPAPASR